MSKEEQLLQYWRELTIAQQEEALNFLKVLTQKTAEPIASPLGQRWRRIRQRIVASGTSLLTWDDLEKEIADRRGGEAARNR